MQQITTPAFLACLLAFTSAACAQDQAVAIRGIYGHPKPFWDKGAKLNDYGVNAVFVHSGAIDDELVKRARGEGCKVFAEFATLNGGYEDWVEETPRRPPDRRRRQPRAQGDLVHGRLPDEQGIPRLPHERAARAADEARPRRRLARLPPLARAVRRSVPAVHQDLLQRLVPRRVRKAQRREGAGQDDAGEVEVDLHQRAEAVGGLARLRCSSTGPARSARSRSRSAPTRSSATITPRGRTKTSAASAVARSGSISASSMQHVDVFAPMLYHGRSGKTPESVQRVRRRSSASAIRSRPSRENIRSSGRSCRPTTSRASRRRSSRRSSATA